MLEGLLERLHLITVCTTEEMKDFDRWSRLNEDRKMLRLELELYKTEKENELAQVTEAMDEIDYMDAMADSFAGGPGAEGGVQ